MAIIMDGNGRWALERGLPRLAGHRAGAEAVRRTVRAAPALGIGTLTLYAFSADNWRRPPSEVEHLMHLMRRYLRKEGDRCEREGVRLEVIGRRDRLEGDLREAIEAVESRTRTGTRLRLRLAIDYSARDAIVEAARLHAGRSKHPRSPTPSRDEFRRLLGRAMHGDDPILDVDLLIRTGGERRLSDFLLWECAYAELVFIDLYWPDFDAVALEGAVAEFHRRDRRFGAVGPVPEVRHG